MDHYAKIEKAMKRVKPDLDEFSRQKTKHKIKPKKIKKDPFVKNLDRIVTSLERRKISKNEAMKKLKNLIG